MKRYEKLSQLTSKEISDILVEKFEYYAEKNSSRKKAFSELLKWTKENTTLYNKERYNAIMWLLQAGYNKIQRVGAIIYVYYETESGDEQVTLFFESHKIVGVLFEFVEESTEYISLKSLLL